MTAISPTTGGLEGHRGISNAFAVRRLGKLLRHRRVVSGGADRAAVRGDGAGRGDQHDRDRAHHARVRNADGGSLLRGPAQLCDPERALAPAQQRRAGDRRFLARRGDLHVDGASPRAPPDRLRAGAGGLDLPHRPAANGLRRVPGRRDLLASGSRALAVHDRSGVADLALRRDPQCLGRGHVHRARPAAQTGRRRGGRVSGRRPLPRRDSRAAAGAQCPNRTTSPSNGVSRCTTCACIASGTAPGCTGRRRYSRYTNGTPSASRMEMPRAT